MAPMLSPDQFVEVVVGDDLILSTNFTGFNLPITNIFWTRNGEFVSSAADRITIIILEIRGPNGTTTLTLSPVNAPNEGGTYIVTVMNPAGRDRTVFGVNVTCKLMSHIVIVQATYFLIKLLQSLDQNKSIM